MTNDFKGKAYYEQKQDWGKSPIVQGCLRYFPRAIKAVAEVSAYGYTKYKSWGGWVLVVDGYNRYTDALGRHLVDGQIEERNPNDANLLHDAQAAWNALARLELKLLEIENRNMGAIDKPTTTGDMTFLERPKSRDDWAEDQDMQFTGIGSKNHKGLGG